MLPDREVTDVDEVVAGRGLDPFPAVPSLAHTGTGGFFFGDMLTKKGARNPPCQAKVKRMIPETIN